MLKRKVWIFPVWLWAILALASVAAAALLFALQYPITGSMLEFDIDATNVDTSDNGGGAVIPDDGSDPKSYDPITNHPWDVAFCDAIINGEGLLEFTWTNVYTSEPLFCTVQVSLSNPGAEDLEFVGITVTDAPVIIVDGPACGQPLLAGGGTNIIFSMAPEPAAEAWVDGVLEFEWAIAGTGACP